jgi:uncharacterized protein YwgA
MSQLIFNILKAEEKGRSPIEVIVKNDSTRRKQSKQTGSQKNNIFFRETTADTDKLLLTLDKVLKSAKLKIESVSNIKIISHKEAGLTSQRIVRAIKQALDF